MFIAPLVPLTVNVLETKESTLKSFDSIEKDLNCLFVEGLSLNVKPTTEDDCIP